MTFHRIAYKPGGFHRRMFTVYDVQEDTVGGEDWYVCRNALTEQPLWLHRKSVVEMWEATRRR